MHFPGFHHLSKTCIYLALILNVYIHFSLSETYEQKRQEHTAELLKKEEEMRQTFVIKVKEKEGELKEAEREVSNENDNMYIVSFSRIGIIEIRVFTCSFQMACNTVVNLNVNKKKFFFYLVCSTPH